MHKKYKTRIGAAMEEFLSCCLAPEALRESFRVDLNTAGVDAMTTLPGLGEKKARAILEYRLTHGSFRSLGEVAQVPGVTQDMIDGWQGLVYLS